MRRFINVAIAALVLLLAAGVVVAAIVKARDAAARTQCQNNLKQIAVALHSSCDAQGAFPPATVPNEDLPYDRRLSWLVDLVPYADQLGLHFDRSQPWDAGDNRIPMTLPDDRYEEYRPPHPIGQLRFLICPSNPAVAGPDSPGLTHYVGVTGVGPDVGELSLGYPGIGFFGYDRRPKIKDISDGTSNTLMVVETTHANGPWTAGGYPTARGLTPDGGSYLGAGGPFGGGHRACKGWLPPASVALTNVAFADGSVRALTDSISPEALEAMATIAGGEILPPGDEW